MALDLEDFTAFAGELRTRGWTQEARREHRWRGPSGSLIDLLPSSPGLRKAKRIIWPDSELVMSLVGFEHVFTRSRAVLLRRGRHVPRGPSAGHRFAQDHRLHG